MRMVQAGGVYYMSVTISFFKYIILEKFLLNKKVGYDTYFSAYFMFNVSFSRHFTQCTFTHNGLFMTFQLVGIFFPNFLMISEQMPHDTE